MLNLKSHPKTAVCDFLAERLAQSSKTQREIATECGFEYPNIIAMFKMGTTKIPLIHVGPLAKALDADPAHFLRVVMTEYMPETWDGIENIMHGCILTANELELVRLFRTATDDKDPHPSALHVSPDGVFTLETQE